MVEIRYGEYYEMADLAGKSVAQAREQYKPAFDIPSRAKAKLNSKPVKQKLEAETILNDEDKLSFEVKSRRGLILVGAFLLAIAITGGLFAYTYTTASATIGAVAVSDFAEVEPYESVEFTTRVFGHYRGDIPSGKLFKITPETDYTGDLNVKVYLTNADELTYAYKHLNMMFELLDADGSVVNVNWTNYFKTAKDSFEKSYDILETAKVAFSTARDTFNSAWTTYTGGGGVVTFTAALDTWLDAIRAFEDALERHEADKDAFHDDYLNNSEYYDKMTFDVTLKGKIDAFIAEIITFNGRIDTYQADVETWREKVQDWRDTTIDHSTFVTAKATFDAAVADGILAYWSYYNTDWDALDSALDSFLNSEDITSLGHEWQLLTLDNGQITLDFSPSWGNSPFYVNLMGGGFRTHGRSPLDWTSGYSVEPILYLEVTQR